MIIRKAQGTDVKNIVPAILEIEAKGGSNTFNNLIGSATERTADILTHFFQDEENHGTELSLETYLIAEIEGEFAGCLSVHRKDDTYNEMKSELFQLHLSKYELVYFLDQLKKIPAAKIDIKNKIFLEYIYTNKKWRGKGVAGKLIEAAIEQTKASKIYLFVLPENIPAIKLYQKLNFEQFADFRMDQDPPEIFPASFKILMKKNIN